MPKSIPLPTDYEVGTTITFKAGPSQVIRTGEVVGHSGQFIEVKVDNKTLKTRPGLIVA